LVGIRAVNPKVSEAVVRRLLTTAPEDVGNVPKIATPFFM
jgi:hypothetical protein